MKNLAIYSTLLISGLSFAQNKIEIDQETAELLYTGSAATLATAGAASYWAAHEIGKGLGHASDNARAQKFLLEEAIKTKNTALISSILYDAKVDPTALLSFAETSADSKTNRDRLAAILSAEGPNSAQEKKVLGLIDTAIDLKFKSSRQAHTAFSIGAGTLIPTGGMGLGLSAAGALISDDEPEVEVPLKRSSSGH